MTKSDKRSAVLFPCSCFEQMPSTSGLVKIEMDMKKKKLSSWQGCARTQFKRCIYCGCSTAAALGMSTPRFHLSCEANPLCENFRPPSWLYPTCASYRSYRSIRPSVYIIRLSFVFAFLSYLFVVSCLPHVSLPFPLPL